MVKAYLRYEQIAGFGAIASPTSAAVPIPNSKGQSLVATAGADALQIWNLRKAEIVARYGNSSTRKAGTITAIAVSEDAETMAAGYSDGSIRLWSLKNNTNAFDEDEPQPSITFNGHRSGVSCIKFLEKGRLVSGSNDGDLIVWNATEEVGLFRIAAHNDVVTSVVTVKRGEEIFVVIASKDGLVKVYDMETQHCVQTIVGHRAEVWGMGVAHGSVLITGSVDAEIRAFVIVDGEKETVFKGIGSVQRFKAADRVMSVEVMEKGGEVYCAIASGDKSAEVFRVRGTEEAKAHVGRRKKRLKAAREKKARDEAQEKRLDEKDVEKAVKDIGDVNVELEAKDFLVSVRKLRLSGKVRWIGFLNRGGEIQTEKSNGMELQLVMQMKGNALEVHKAVVISKKKKKRKNDENEDVEEEQSLEKVLSLDFAGHRDDIRSVSLAPDDTTVLSASKQSVKLWNIATQRCIRSIPIGGYGLCTALLGADASRGVVGLKEGSLHVLDLGTGTAVAEVKDAHKGAVWDMCLDDHIYEADTLITCGADKRICFWSIEDVLVGTTGNLKLKRVLEMPDEILCVRVAYGRDRPVLVAALLDSTVRAFFLDSLEPYLNFYGHRLPVMALDVSSDGLILATGSADKTIKLWGMDFGDCRRSIRAHSDSVLSVAFQPKTHYLFSGSRDGMLKYWDGDKFELICDLEGQRGEVWALTVSDDGEVVVSASHDRTVRAWRRTDEPLFLEEEKDRRMDEMFESTLLDEDFKEAAKARKTTGFLLDKSKGEATEAGKRSLETVKGGERLLEALELCEDETRRIAESPEEPPSPLLLGLAPQMYMLRVLEQIRTSDLEQALHILPLDAAARVLEYCNELLDPHNSATRLATEMLAKAAMYLIRLHHSQITAGAVKRKVVAQLQERMTVRIEEMRSRMGFNCAALGFWRIEMTERDDAPFRDASARAFNIQKEAGKKAKKRRTAGVLV